MNRLIMKETIDTMYQGKMSNLVAAFAEREELQEPDVKELEKLINKFTKE